MSERLKIGGTTAQLIRREGAILPVWLASDESDPRMLSLHVGGIVADLDADDRDGLRMALHAFDDAPDSWPSCLLPDSDVPVTGKRMNGSGGACYVVDTHTDLTGTVMVRDDCGFYSTKVRALTPAPKLRPRTAEECWSWFSVAERELRFKASGEKRYVEAVGSDWLVFARDANGHTLRVPFATALKEWEHLDGRPFGILEN